MLWRFKNLVNAGALHAYVLLPGDKTKYLSDLRSGDPVMVGPYVVAANQSGRMLAIDARNGQRVWTRNLGSVAPIWAAGDTIFLVSDDAKLMRVSTPSHGTTEV